MATGGLHKKFVKIGPAVPEICSRTDTHRQDKLITIHCSPTRVEELQTLTTICKRNVADNETFVYVLTQHKCITNQRLQCDEQLKQNNIS